jgi:uncharacterized protein (UPF0332 family)
VRPISEEDYVEEELEKAEAALEDARLLKESDASTPAVLNRLYYACYHAAKAFLFSQDEDPYTHSGVATRYGQLLKEEKEGRKKGSFLSRMSTLREKADYEYERLDEDHDQLMKKTQEFLRYTRRKIEEEES